MRFLHTFTLTALLLPALAIVARADTIGNSAIPAPSVDTCAECDYVLNQAFAAAGETVTSYSLYANQAGDITPILFTEDTAGGSEYFTVTGVGAAQTVSAGMNSFGFDLATGSAVTGSNTYFGFFSGTPAVAFSYGAAAGVFFGVPGDTTLGTTFDGGENSVVLMDQLGGVNDRVYSINATAVSGVTPEPSALSLMGLGLAGVGAVLRRRRVV